MKPESDNSNEEPELWSECQKSQDPQSALALVHLMSGISPAMYVCWLVHGD